MSPNQKSSTCKNVLVYVRIIAATQMDVATDSKIVDRFRYKLSLLE